MQSIRRRLRSFTWLVLTTMLGFALAPTVSHALALGGQSTGFNPWAEICSAAGVNGVVTLKAADAQGQPTPAPKQAGAAHLEHCPLCGSVGHTPLLPTGTATVMAAVDGADFVPALFALAPRPLFAWAAAQPRGPPHCS